MKRIILFILAATIAFGNLQAQSKLKNIPKKPLVKGKLSGTPANPAPYRLTNVAPSNYFDIDPDYKRSIKHYPTIPLSKLGPKITSWSDNGLPLWIEGRLVEGKLIPGSTESMAKQYLSVMSRFMKIRNAEDEFVLINSTKDINNVDHLTFDQYYMGIPVYGGQYKVHVDKEGPLMANGRYYPTPELSDINASISLTNANDLVRKDLERTVIFKDLSANELKLVENHQQFKTQLVVYHKDRSDSKERLTWHVVVYPTIIKRFEYFVDAKTGEIIHSFDNLCGISCNINHECGDPLDGPVTANATDLNNMSRTLNIYQVGGKFYMEDASKSMFKPATSTMPNDPTGAIVTLDGLNDSPENQNFNYVLLSSNNNTWSDKSSVSAHWNASEAYKYFLSTFNRTAIDGKGGNIISLVNIAETDGSGLDNAFWNGQAMFYGNGSTSFKALAGGLDVGGHEMSHGVIGSTANLEYENESGALNESYADVFGAMIDRDDWLMGENIVKTSQFPSGALRSLSDPHNGGNSIGQPGYQPKHVNEKYTGTQDNGGVHINSGIPNYAFYLFATNANVGKDKAEQVYYKALTDYLVKSSVFIDARAAVVKAATDLYGAGSVVVTAANSAFTSVGIGSGGDPGGTSYQKNLPVNPGSDLIVVTDQSFNGVYIASGTNFSNIDQVSSLSPANKFSVTDDGTAIFFVADDQDIHALTIDYSSGNVNEVAITNDGFWSNVAISKDGNRLAAITNEEVPVIWVFDYILDKWTSFDLYNPTYTEGITTADVLYPDALEWDYSGNYVMYDALNQTKDANGFLIEYWDIGFLRAYDKKTGKYGDGEISKLYNALPENTSIGNPTFSKNSPYIIAFDYIDDFNEDYYLAGVNFENGNEGGIFNQGEVGYPSYSRLDDALIFNVQDEDVGYTSLGGDKITYGGNEFILFTEARLASWFSNGFRDINIATNEELEAVKIWKLSPTITSGEINIKSTETTDKAIVQIFDAMGRPVYTSHLGSFSEGSSENIKVSSLSAGNYFMRIQAGAKVQTAKFVKY